MENPGIWYLQVLESPGKQNSVLMSVRTLLTALVKNMMSAHAYFLAVRATKRRCCISKGTCISDVSLVVLFLTLFVSACSG